MNFKIKNGVLERYNGKAPDVVIPSCVTEIGKEAFKDNKFLKSVIITGNVTVIGDSAFEWCDNLEKIVIPEGVTIIGEGAFRWCTELEKIVIPEGVTTIGDSAFEWCSNLEKITIPEGVTIIGDSAFEFCINLEEIVIPESVTEIGDGAFWYTKWLENKMATEKNVVIVNGIAIERANNIEESVNLEDIKEIKKFVFCYYRKVKEFIISDGLKIEYRAFLTENDFNICLKHDDFSVNIPIKQSELENIKLSSGTVTPFYNFNTRTESLFKFIGAGIEQKEILFDDLEIPEYRYPLAVFMANVYESEFFKAFVDVHSEKILEYAKNNDPDLLKLISSKY